MAVEMYFTWGQGSASVAAGETVTVPVTADIAPSVDKLSALFSPYAAVDSATTSAVIIRGISAGSITVPTGRDIAPQSMMDMTTYPAFTLTVTAPVEDESYLNKRGLTHFWENIDDLKQNKLTAGAGILITNDVISATGGGTADAVDWGHITGSMSNQTDLMTALNAKANSADLATVATSGDYDDLTDKPTIGNATLTIQKNGTSAGTFTANATSNKTINITVPTSAADVSALPASTKYGASIAVSINTTDYKVTTTLKDQDGNTLGTAQVIDLPLESVVVNGSYDSTNKKIVLTLQSGSTIDIPVGDLVAGLQSEITSTNKLASDLVDDTNQTNKFMTSAEKTKLSGIAAGAEVNVQSDWTQTTTTADDYIKNKPSLATVATSGSYNDLSNKPTIPTVNNATLTIQRNGTNVQTFTANSSSNKTANITVPTKTSDLTNDGADNTSTYVEADELATVATTGSYADLTNKPTIPAAQVQSDWTQATTTAVDYIKNKPNLATVATSGSYNDLSNKPTIPTVNNATLTIQKNGTTVKTFTANASSNVTANITVPTKTSDLTNDSGFLDSVAWGDVTGKPTFATVATSGSYNDLSNKPTIPAAQVQSNWTQTTTTAVDYIKNKPTLATVATSGSYNDLSNKPTIPTVNNATLTIQKNGSTVKTFTANASSNVTANITVPTKTSDLTNDSGFVNSTAIAGKQDLLTAGDHINITGTTIKAVDYVHSEQPVATSSVTPVVTGSMISNGTITADKLATGATLKLTLSTSDIGEGAALAANTLYGVYI